MSSLEPTITLIDCINIQDSDIYYYNDGSYCWVYDDDCIHVNINGYTSYVSDGLILSRLSDQSEINMSKLLNLDPKYASARNNYRIQLSRYIYYKSIRNLQNNANII